MWARALTLTLLALVAWEALGRAAGYQATVSDHPSLWTYHRLRVTSRPDQIVVLGDSRIAHGVCMRTLRQRCPEQPIAMLAVPGHQPVGALRDLAEDDSFRGLVMCAMRPHSFTEQQWGSMDEWVQYRKRGAFADRWAAPVRAWFQARLVVLSAQMSIRTITRSLVRTRKMEPPTITTVLEDRSEMGDFVKRSKVRRRPARADELGEKGNAATAAKWAADARVVGGYVRRIQERGGKVVFIRTPSNEAPWEIEQYRFPRAQHWDRLTELTGAPTVHFQDYPTMARFTAPDMSHLDYRDTPAFTNALVDQLREMGILPPGPPARDTGGPCGPGD